VYQCQGAITDETVQKQRKSFCEEYLGPLDGNATERAWHHIETHTIQHKTASPLRTSLDEQAPAFCKREIYRSGLQVFFWNLVKKSLLLWYPIWKRLRPSVKKQVISPPQERYRQILSTRIAYWSHRVKDCRVVLAKNRPHL
jgi:HrpA-like RNA helicase